MIDDHDTASGTAPTMPGERVHGLGEREFIALVAMIGATTAMSIDAVLPAFEDLESQFGESTQVSLTITTFFFGIALGQLFWGPMTDRFGRRPIMQVSLVLFAAASLAATLAPSFGFLLVSRFVWGLAAAGPRVVSVAIVRDAYDGDAMARIMSMAMAVFFVVPILAPLLGAGLLTIGGWRLTFGISTFASLGLLVWFRRCNETLAATNQRSLEFAPLLRAAREVLTHSITAVYLVAQICLYAAFFPWLGSSETILRELYGYGAGGFAVFFALNAVVMAASIAASGRIVERVGSERLVQIFLPVTVVLSLAGALVARAGEGVPQFAVFFVFATALTSLNAMLSPLLSTIAILPMGHIAGTATAVTGAFLFGLGATLAGVTDRLINDSVTPFFVAYAIYAFVALVGVLVIRGRPTRLAVEQAS